MKNRNSRKRNFKKETEKLCFLLCVVFIISVFTYCGYLKKTPQELVIETLGDEIFSVYINTEFRDSAERKVRTEYQKELRELQQKLMYGGYAVQFDQYHFQEVLEEGIEQDINKEVKKMQQEFENDTLNQNKWFLQLLANCKEDYIFVGEPLEMENVNLYDISFLNFDFVARQELDNKGRSVSYELIIP